tara:strand:- start:205 stop:333 length:129 start_codon:yes stop_codon:yes gene_type:complete
MKARPNPKKNKLASKTHHKNANKTERHIFPKITSGLSPFFDS